MISPVTKNPAEFIAKAGESVDEKVTFTGSDGSKAVLYIRIKNVFQEIAILYKGLNKEEHNFCEWQFTMDGVIPKIEGHELRFFKSCALKFKSDGKLLKVKENDRQQTSKLWINPNDYTASEADERIQSLIKDVNSFKPTDGKIVIRVLYWKGGVFLHAKEPRGGYFAKEDIYFRSREGEEFNKCIAKMTSQAKGYSNIWGVKLPGEAEEEQPHILKFPNGDLSDFKDKCSWDGIELKLER